MLNLVEAEERIRELEKDLDHSNKLYDYWKNQMLMAGPAVDAMKELQALFCPKLSHSTLDVAKTVEAIKDVRLAGLKVLKAWSKIKF